MTKQQILEYRRYTGRPECAGQCKARHPHDDLVAATYQPADGRPVLILHLYSCDKTGPLPDLADIVAETRAAIEAAHEAGVDFDLGSIPGDDPMAALRAVATGKAGHHHA